MKCKPDWENLEVIQKNKEEGHALASLYTDSQSAISREDSPFKQSLNGEWQFYFQQGLTYGILVMDEVDLESHCARTRLPRSDERWLAPRIDRARRMVLRDRNHACVFFWSLGNEAGTCSTVIRFAMYDKEVSQNHYSHMPVVLCEYAHCMGNSLGNFSEFTEAFYKYPHMCGGFICDFVDQSIKKGAAL